MKLFLKFSNFSNSCAYYWNLKKYWKPCAYDSNFQTFPVLVLTIQFLVCYVAICDNLMLICSFWIFTLAKFFHFTVGFVPFLFSFGQTFSTISVWLDCFLTFERFLSVSFPIKHEKICGNLKKTSKILIILSLLAIFFELPRFWEIKIVWQKNCAGNLVWVSASNPMRETEIYSSAKLLVGYFALNFIGPFLWQTTLNVRIIFGVRKAAKIRQISAGYQKIPVEQKNGKSNDEESSTTTMLL